MYDHQKTQTCPYCKHKVEDYESVWEYEAEEEVTCSNCKRVYVAKPQYQFTGWLVEQKCGECGEWTDDGMFLCDCEDEKEEDD